MCRPTPVPSVSAMQRNQSPGSAPASAQHPLPARPARRCPGPRSGPARVRPGPRPVRASSKASTALLTRYASGIGLARVAARQGAGAMHVVIAAEAAERVADEVGGTALVDPLSDPDAVDSLPDDADIINNVSPPAPSRRSADFPPERQHADPAGDGGGPVPDPAAHPAAHVPAGVGAGGQHLLGDDQRQPVQVRLHDLQHALEGPRKVAALRPPGDLCNDQPARVQAPRWWSSRSPRRRACCIRRLVARTGDAGAKAKAIKRLIEPRRAPGSCGCALHTGQHHRLLAHPGRRLDRPLNRPLSPLNRRWTRSAGPFAPPPGPVTG